MTWANTRTMAQPAPVMALRGTRAVMLQTGLILAAALLPSLFHAAHAPVRWLVPMHWPVLLAALAYGWRGGLAAGLISPVAATALTGLPVPLMLPAITLELTAYGLAAGFLRETLRWSRWASLAVALVVGRVVFAVTAGISVTGFGGLLPYLYVALLPGIPAALAQLAVLPAAARWWMKREVGE